MVLPSTSSPTNNGGVAMPSSGGSPVDLHEVAKGWKAAISRAKDPATRYVFTILCVCVCMYVWEGDAHLHAYFFFLVEKHFASV